MEQNIPFIEKNIFVATLNEQELTDILMKSENGTDDIISLRSKVIKEKNVKLDDMTVSEMIQFIRQNPTVLKRPIMVDDSHIQVGYDKDEMTTFIPKARRLNNFVCDTCEDTDK
jgi:regulatory protein spx